MTERPAPRTSHNSQTFTFEVSAKGLRFDQFLALNFPAISLTRLRNAIKQGAARMNNGRMTMPGWILQPGDLVTLQIDPGEPTAALPENIPLDILFEDDDLLIINKAVGLLSHPSSTEKSGTVMNALAYHFLHSPHKPGSSTARPVLLHRLDRDTSGVLAIAKNERANRIVSKAFRNRKVKKNYLALVHGAVTNDSGEIDAPLGRNPQSWPRWCVKEDGDASQTKFTVRQRFTNYTFLELEPLTGRTHQLRIHCAHLGHPIVGDQVYKGSVSTEAAGIHVKHQMLHAQRLSFRHPSTGEDMDFIAPLPKVIAAAIAQLEKND